MTDNCINYTTSFKTGIVNVDDMMSRKVNAIKLKESEAEEDDDTINEALIQTIIEDIVNDVDSEFLDEN